MTRFSLYIAGFTTDPSQTPIDRKVADVVVEDSGMARLTFVSPAIKSPQVYDSLDQLKQVHCGEGRKAYLQPAP